MMGTPPAPCMLRCCSTPAWAEHDYGVPTAGCRGGDQWHRHSDSLPHSGGQPACPRHRQRKICGPNQCYSALSIAGQLDRFAGWRSVGTCSAPCLPGQGQPEPPAPCRDALDACWVSSWVSPREVGSWSPAPWHGWIRRQLLAGQHPTGICPSVVLWKRDT